LWVRKLFKTDLDHMTKNDELHHQYMVL